MSAPKWAVGMRSPYLLTPAQVSEALESIHGRELRELLDYAEAVENQPEMYLECVSYWLISHGKVKPEGS